MDSVAGPPPFILRDDQPRAPFVFAVPHSGRHYPNALTDASNLSRESLRASEDAFVDLLFSGIEDDGAGLLIARYGRAFLDLNRSADELDPILVPGAPQRQINQSARVKTGLGVIPRVVAPGRDIYPSPLSLSEANERISTIYLPYHSCLASMLERRVQSHGSVFLIDCHSMPSMKITNRGVRRRRREADIVLGDCWGAACHRDFTATTERLLTREGFVVRRNIPYAGGYATEHYGNPARDIHALQIEINRAVYMDEAKLRPLPHFQEVRNRLLRVSRALIRQFGQQRPLAAE